MNFYYVHVPKTGGTSLREIFYKNLPDNEVLFVDGEKGVELYTDERLENLRAIGGHLPLWKFMNAGKGENYPCVKFSVLRHPVDRLLSLYNYLSVSQHPDHRKYAGLDFKDFVALFAASRPPSLHMCYSFARDGDFKKSKANILKHDVAIYSLENIDSLLTALGSLLGIDAELQHLNSSRKSVTHADLSGLDIDFMSNDLRLYESYESGELPVLSPP